MIFDIFYLQGNAKYSVSYTKSEFLKNMAYTVEAKK